MNVLLIEDDDAIALPLERGLIHHGYAVTRVASGAAALVAESADIVLLDLGLPDIDGLDVCKAIRLKNPNQPIIVISARGSEIDRVVGLELGADDYLSKPFGMRELIARMRAVLRRSGSDLTVNPTTNGQPAPSREQTERAEESVGAVEDSRQRIIGALIIDFRAHRVSLNGAEITLTAKEFGVLSVLSVDPGAVVTRSDLIEQVWDEHWYGPTKTLDVHVAQLRKKLGNPGWIENVRSVGYRLVDPGS